MSCPATHGDCATTSVVLTSAVLDLQTFLRR